MHNTTLPALGLRIYCPWFPNSYPDPQYAAYIWGDMTGKGDNGSDRSRFGQSVIEADLDGDTYPEWIATQPRDHTTGALDQGWLHVTWTYNTQLWDVPLPDVTGITQMQSSFEEVWVTYETIDEDGNSTTEAPD